MTNQPLPGKASPLGSTRDSNIELFRILSMLLIIAHHYVVNSGLIGAGGPVSAHILSLRSQFLLYFSAFGKTGINCFVLITGYFMCTSNITAKKFFKLLFEIMFYKVVISSLFWICGYAPVTFSALFKTLMPTTSIAQNFPGTYLAFFLFIPFLNILVHHMTELQHLRLLLLCSVIYILFGTFPVFSVTMNYVSWYMVLYFIASYIRLYPKKFFERTAFWGIAAAVCVALSLLSVLECSRRGVNAYRYVTDSNTLLAVLTGLSAFLFFRNLKLKQNKLINAFSASTFGVLLIHANSDMMRQWLWKDVCNNVGMYSSPWMPLHAVGSVIVIFVVCSLIDMLRIRFVERPFFRFFDRHYPRWAGAVSRAEASLCKRFHIGRSDDRK